MKTQSWTDEQFAVALVTGVCLLSVCARVLATRDVGGTNALQQKAADLAKQSARWQALALQDRNAVFGLRHANYASGYLESARHLVSDTALRRITGRRLAKCKTSF